MEAYESPILKMVRLLEPNLDANCVELLDISDAVETIQKSPKFSKKSPKHFPILRIPSYSNDVLLGEELHMAFILGNQTKIKFSDVVLKVEMVPEHADTLDASSIFENVELEPNCKPLESHYKYLFKTVSQYRMTCSVEYSSHKGPLILKKMFMWKCINPVELSHTLVKLPDGVHHLETEVENRSKSLLVLKETKLENRADNKVYLPLEKFSRDNIKLLRPDEKISIIFPNIHLHYRNFNNFRDINIDSHGPYDKALDSITPSNFNTKESDGIVHSPTNSFDDFYINIDWHSYTNVSGTNVSKVEPFSHTSDLFYKVKIPKNVKINVPFNIDIFLKNLTGNPFDVILKFKNSKEFILQSNSVEKVHLNDSDTISLPLIAVCSGLHGLDGIELHCNNNCYNVTNLQVLVTN
ncbi:hypothetical protein MACK_002719 [Theileria orientalis]|uniref:Trafficking protein particle complex subunit 13 C-terminal domain-containing protein n=1 Tax=Theileria orientalis TaxID=68886 RepID=A0A976MF57_THEOR|nr:hypothetical protein MACK_002719 [Theileria orientalis]